MGTALIWDFPIACTMGARVHKSSRSGPSPPPNRRSVARFMDDQGGMLMANDMANVYHKHGHSNVGRFVCAASYGGASSAVRAQCNYLGVWPY